MDLADDITIAAPREKVFAALNDAAILQQAIPGCEELNALSKTEYEGVVGAKVGPLKARFKGQARLEDVNAPQSYTLLGEGKAGPAGRAKVRASVQLTEDGNNTLMHYEVHADIGGKLAQLGGALVQNTAKKLAGEFFANLESQIAEPDDEAPTQIADIAAPDTGVTSNNTWWWLAAGAAVLIAIALFAL